MAKTISFHLQKGGGENTISGTLACQSALDGYRTLLVDVDPQGNASSWFLNAAPTYELADVVQGKCFIQDAIVPVPQIPNLFVLPTFGIGGTLKLYSETKLAVEPYVLKVLIKDVSDTYDRIILDLSPGLGRLERAALISSDEVITPMTPEVFSLDGLEIFIDELNKLRKNLRSPVRHTKIIINSFDNRIKQHRDIYTAACEGFYYIRFCRCCFVKHKQVVPQLFKVRGKGLKESTIDSIKTLNKEIWR